MFNKFSDRANHGKIADVKRDAWSDLVGNGLSSIGISQTNRDQAQAVIDYGKNQILPKGGAVPDARDESNVGSKVISTGYAVGLNQSTLLIIGGIVILVAGYYIIKKA